MKNTERKGLLMQVKDGDKILAPQFPAHFLHVGYLNAVSPEARRYDLSWTDWLQKFAEVQSIPRLASSRDPTKLSDVFLHIAKHRGDRLVGALAAHWPSYSTSMTDEIAQNAIESLRNLRECRRYAPETDLHAPVQVEEAM